MLALNLRPVIDLLEHSTYIDRPLGDSSLGSFLKDSAMLCIVGETTGNAVTLNQLGHVERGPADRATKITIAGHVAVLVVGEVLPTIDLPHRID